MILHGKKQLLSFRNADGTYNTLRFLFSKWTLKEGWDNPNVFTIAKLRSSGSENSKLQEVGRGLRLPVDENGNRISNEEFQLNYIVDFTEADFAQRLVDQINGEIHRHLLLQRNVWLRWPRNSGMSADDLFDELYDINATSTGTTTSVRKQGHSSLKNTLHLHLAYQRARLKTETKKSQGPSKSAKPFIMKCENFGSISISAICCSMTLTWMPI